MKSTILIAMLATLVACNSETKSSNACIFNSELSECVSEGDTSPDRDNDEVVLSAKVVSTYTGTNSSDAGIRVTNKITNSLFCMM